MAAFTTLPCRIHGWLDTTRKLDFLAPLLLRLFLAPVFIAAGLTKMATFDSTVSWFGNPEWGLGLPFRDTSGRFSRIGRV